MPAPDASGQAPASVPTRHLTVDKTLLRQSDGRPFLWRGVTAFRLLELLVSGQSDEVEAYLRWAAGEQLNVVRVLAMAEVLFDLPPERGRAHLEDLIQRAARHGLYVEIVALADTDELDVPLDEQVRAVGQIAARHPNTLVEIANEPYHPTQRDEVHEISNLVKLSSLVPDVVPVAIGATQEPEDAGGGDYVTFHFSRSGGDEGWGHVRDLVQGRDLMRLFGKPTINDEPIGAGAAYQQGRRENNPERLRANALMTRMIGLGATFHYEGGLHARIPEGLELECFRAWQEAWQLLPEDIEVTGAFQAPGDPPAAVRRLNGNAASVWEVQRGDAVWVLIAGTRGDVSLDWNDGWQQVGIHQWAGSRLVRGGKKGF